MAEPILPINPLQGAANPAQVNLPGRVNFTGNIFDDALARAIEGMGNVSNSEFYANDLINKYVAGQADVSDVLIATSKMNIMVQLATSVINSAVTTFKELTQMQI